MLFLIYVKLYKLDLNLAIVLFTGINLVAGYIYLSILICGV